MIARLLFNKVSLVVFLLIAAWFIINSFAPDQVGISGISWSNASASVCSNGAQTFQCKGILTHRNTSNRAYHFPDVGGEVLLAEAEQFVYNKVFLDSTFESPTINNASFSLATIRDLAEPLSIEDGGFGVDNLAEFFTFVNQNVQIEARHIDGEAISSSKIRNNSVSTSKIKDRSLVAANMASDVKIPPENIPAGFGTTIKFANGSVVSDKIGLLERANFNFSSVRNEHIVDGSIGESSFSSGSATKSKLASNSVTSDKILNGTIAAEDFSSRIDLDVELPDYEVATQRLSFSAQWGRGQPSDSPLTSSRVITKSFTANRLMACAVGLSSHSVSRFTANRWADIYIGGANYRLPITDGASDLYCYPAIVNIAVSSGDSFFVTASCRNIQGNFGTSIDNPINYNDIGNSGVSVSCFSNRLGNRDFVYAVLWRE